jgi:hypothetical protein
MPGFSVVMWISRFSSVAVGDEQTVRTEPVLFGLSTILFQSNTFDPMTGAAAGVVSGPFWAKASASPATAVAARAANNSLRFIVVFLFSIYLERSRARKAVLLVRCYL